MARVSGDDVKEIINTSLAEVDVYPFILTANALVTAKCTGVGYSDEELAEIEKWLAAHFISVRDPSRSAVLSKTISDATDRYALVKGNPSNGLEATPYGQQVLLIDYMGTLSNLGKRRVSMRTFGAQNDEF